MGTLSKIRKHMAVASGNFAVLFKEVKIPQLPAAVTCLIQEFNKADPDIHQLARIISSDVELSAKVMRTVNSALFGLPNPVTSIQNGIMLLGLRSIRTLALSYSMRSAIPRPEGDLFNQEGFWADSLLRALLARTLAARFPGKEEDETFTASLLSNLAMPVLLSVWGDYYRPVVEQWRQSNASLSELERKNFGWDHAQAGAWILKSWDFPDEIVGLVGTHCLSMQEMADLGLDQTIALPIATAAQLPSVLRPETQGSEAFVETACDKFSLSREGLGGLLSKVKAAFDEIREQFEIKECSTGTEFENIMAFCDPEQGEAKP